MQYLGCFPPDTLLQKSTKSTVLKDIRFPLAYKLVPAPNDITT